MASIMDSVTLEVRPRLCAVNAFICLKKCPAVTSVSVRLIEKSVILEIENRTIHLLLYPVKIIPETLSSLRIVNNWISFRIQTNPPDSLFGTFRAEILGTKEIPNNIFGDLSSIPLPNKNKKHVLRCANCQAYVTRIVKFDRVLPLPSNEFDQSEWFCCAHKNNANQQVYSILGPRDSDYLYGPYYCVLNKCTFMRDLKLTDVNIHCHRCLSILGSPQDNDSFKLWNCSIEYESIDEDDANVSRVPASAPFHDFLLAIKESMGFLAGEQILLETWDKNCMSYILLKLMDFQVNLLTETDEQNYENDVIRLQQLRVIKVIYTYGESERSLANDYLNAKYSRVAPKVLVSGLEQLLSSTKRFLPEYRIIDGNFIGYLKLPNSSS